MKILYIAYSCSPVNGSEDKIGWNIPLEASKYNQVFVLTAIEQKPYIEEYIAKNPVKNITFLYADIPSFYKKIYKGAFYSGRLNIWNKRALKIAKEVCEKENISVVHQITPIEFRAIGNYGKIKNVKFILGPIGGAENIPKGLKSYAKGNAFLEFIRKMLNSFAKFKLKVTKRLDNCHAIFFSNKETLEYLSPLVKCESKIISELAIGKTDIVKTEKELKEKTTFLFAGRLVYRKGVDFMLDAFESLNDNADYELRIVGTGKQFDKIKNRCALSEKLKNHVVVTGKIPYEEMKNEYEKASVFILPSIRETGGMVVAEALSNALPVITINAFGAATVVDEDCGFLYNGNTKQEFIDSLSKILLECIENKEMLVKKSKNALKKVEKYTWEEKLLIYSKFYN